MKTTIEGWLILSDERLNNRNNIIDPEELEQFIEYELGMVGNTGICRQSNVPQQTGNSNTHTAEEIHHNMEDQRREEDCVDGSKEGTDSEPTCNIYRQEQIPGTSTYIGYACGNPDQYRDTRYYSEYVNTNTETNGR